jgi:hypothetical protein
MKTKLAFAVLILCALLLMGSGWKAPSAPEILWYVLGGGGGCLEYGSVALEGTLGQPQAGTVSQFPLELCSGYWCGTEKSEHSLYLPFVIR